MGCDQSVFFRNKRSKKKEKKLTLREKLDVVLQWIARFKRRRVSPQNDGNKMPEIEKLHIDSRPTCDSDFYPNSSSSATRRSTSSSDFSSEYDEEHEAALAKAEFYKSVYTSANWLIKHMEIIQDQDYLPDN